MTIIGGGGFRTPLICRELAASRLPVTEVALYDISRPRLDVIASVLAGDLGKVAATDQELAACDELPSIHARALAAGSVRRRRRSKSLNYPVTGLNRIDHLMGRRQRCPDSERAARRDLARHGDGEIESRLTIRRDFLGHAHASRLLGVPVIAGEHVAHRVTPACALHHAGKSGCCERGGPFRGEHEWRFGGLFAGEPAQSTQFVPEDRMGTRSALLDPRDVQGAVLKST